MKRGDVKVRASKLFGTALAVLLAVGLCVNAGPLSRIGGQSALAAGAGSAFAADGAGSSAEDNSWQIVSGAYDAAHTTSQGIADADLSAYNFVASDDGDDGSQVHVTKAVEPTDVEDEFIVHLSVDASATSKQVTDYKSFFENAPYKGTESNSYKSGTVLTASDKEAGAFGVEVSSTEKLKNNGTFDIYDYNKNCIAQDVTLYWNKANNFTILLDVNELLGDNSGRFIIMGVSVKSGNHNELYLSKEAYDLINQAIQGETKWGDPTRLSSVTDVMGDSVEFIGGAKADGGNATYSSETRTLTWNPAYKSEDSYTTVEEEPVVEEEVNDSGAVTKVTVTQRKWCYGVASLTYRVRLNTQAADFKSSYDPGSVSNSYLTNNNATLSYSYSVDGGTTYNDGTVAFPKPAVKGILYDLQALKTNEIATPLAGATFELTRTWTDSFGETHTDLISDALVSDADGYVAIDSLPWGTYTLEETSAPSGHTMSGAATVTFNLCYTSNAGNLTASTITSANHAMLASTTPTVINERVKTDVTLLKVDAETNDPLRGAKFALYKDDGDGSFNEADDLIEANRLAEIETSAEGTAVFSKLTVGTYYLKETYTPAGYELNSKVYRIDVYDVAGAAGGSDGNMIRVGNADGANLQAPNTPNQITVADRPIPSLPVTAGPGARGVMSCGVGLIAIGVLCAASYELHLRRRIGSARHRAG